MSILLARFAGEVIQLSDLSQDSLMKLQKINYPIPHLTRVSNSAYPTIEYFLIWKSLTFPLEFRESKDAHRFQQNLFASAISKIAL